VTPGAAGGCAQPEDADGRADFSAEELEFDDPDVDPSFEHAATAATTAMAATRYRARLVIAPPRS
jgi:hypothetical protein